MSYLEKVRRMSDERGWTLTILCVLCYFLTKMGIHLSPFYYMKEVLPSEIPSFVTAFPDEFEFSAFGLSDVKAMGNLPELRAYAGEQHLIDNFNNREICLGLKYGGEAAALMWISLDFCNSPHFVAAMKSNEAYLHAMYVLKSFRGNNLAPILRYKSYEMLGNIGRNTFYSVTDLFNTASLRFKQKLGARAVFLGVYIKIWGQFKKSCVLKRY